MVVARTEPHVHLVAWIKAVIVQPEQAGFVIKGARHAFDKRREIECHDADLDADSTQVLLNYRRHALARLIAGVGDDGKFNGMSLRVMEHAGVHAETGFYQQPHRPSLIVSMRLELCVEPELVCR